MTGFPCSCGTATVGLLKSVRFTYTFGQGPTDDCFWNLTYDSWLMIATDVADLYTPRLAHRLQLELGGTGWGTLT